MTDLDLITDKPEPMTVYDELMIGFVCGILLAAFMLWAIT